MNTNSNRSAIFGYEDLLGSLPGAAIGPAEADPPRAPSKTPGLLSMADPPRTSVDSECSSLADALRERYPSSPVVVLFLSDHSDETLRAIGLREVERIQGPWPQRVMGSVARPIAPPPSADVAPLMRETARPAAETPAAPRPPTARSLGLTRRQMDVLSLMVQGKPNKLICRELSLAEGTVKCHVSAILRALEVGSRTQAALKAARLGLGAERVAAG